MLGAARALGALPRCAAISARQDLPRDKLLEALPGDHVLGKADAPNIIIDYFSLTCPHCANFHVAVLPTLRKEWIDTGKLRLVHRHFPSDMDRDPGEPARRMCRAGQVLRHGRRPVPQRRSTG